MKEQIKDDEVEIDLLELFHVLIKNAWALILCMILGASVAYGGTKLLVIPQYEATSMIYILSKVRVSLLIWMCRSDSSLR